MTSANRSLQDRNEVLVTKTLGIRDADGLEEAIQTFAKRCMNMLISAWITSIENKFLWAYSCLLFPSAQVTPETRESGVDPLCPDAGRSLRLPNYRCCAEIPFGLPKNRRLLKVRFHAPQTPPSYEIVNIQHLNFS